MYKMIFFVLLISFTAHSGVISKAGGGVVAFYLAKKAVISGGPKVISFAARRLQAHLKANPGDIGVVAGLLTGFAIENAGFTEKAIQLIHQVQALSMVSVNDIKEQSVAYGRAKTIIEAKLESIKSPGRCQLSSYAAFVQTDLSNVLSSPSKPVSLYDVGSYKALRKNEAKNDRMQHDHIPSRAAVHRYLEGKLNTSFAKDSAAFNLIRDNSTVVEVCDDLHCEGRTYKGRNSAGMVALDSATLLSATVRDFSYHLMGSGFDRRVVPAFAEVYNRNNALCLYN
jgi:hypothetical protein